MKNLLVRSPPSILGILGLDLEPIGIVDEFTTLNLRPSFFGAGFFELSAPATNRNRGLFAIDRIIDFAQNGLLAGVIEGIDRNLTSTGPRYRIYGPMLNGLLKRRQVIPSDDPALLGWDVAEGTVGEIMAHYVQDHVILPVSQARAVPNLRLMPGIERIGMLTVAKARYETLSDVLFDLAQYASVGWRIVLSGDALEFQVLSPIDRTAGSENPLMLSTAFGNVSLADTNEDWTEYANTVYALGDGAYENRIYRVVYPDDVQMEGWARRETVADCGNEESTARLKELALQKIADLEKTDSLTLEIIPGTVDLQLGDIVSVNLPEIGAQYDLLTTEFTVNWQAAQTRIDVTLGRPPRTLTDQLKRARRLSNIT